MQPTVDLDDLFGVPKPLPPPPTGAHPQQQDHTAFFPPPPPLPMGPPYDNNDITVPLPPPPPYDSYPPSMPQGQPVGYDQSAYPLRQQPQQGGSPYYGNRDAFSPQGGVPPSMNTANVLFPPPQQQPQQQQQSMSLYGNGYPPIHPQQQRQLQNSIGVPPQPPSASASGELQQQQLPGQSSTSTRTRTQEEEDKEQLEKIIRLRRELEAEQQREQQKREEQNTWGCAQCTYRNQLSSTSCEVCNAGRPGYSAPVPPVQQHQPQPQQAQQQSRPAGVTAWQCGMCLAPNEAHHTRCKVCSAYRQSGTPIPASNTHSNPSTAAGAPQYSGGNNSRTTNWKCSVCGRVNTASQANCPACNGYQRNGIPLTSGPSSSSSGPMGQPAAAAVPATAGQVWSCSVCTLENPVTNAVCSACESGQRPRHLAIPPGTGGAGRDQRRDRHGHMPGSSSVTTVPGGAGSSSTPAPGSRDTWPCPTCTFHNQMRRSKCDMCGAARPAQYAQQQQQQTLSAKEKEARRTQEEESDEDEVQWQDDDVARACNRCHEEFGILRRRHHCRACGYVFCANCSQYYMEVRKGRGQERVCLNCFTAREQEQLREKRHGSKKGK